MKKRKNNLDERQEMKMLQIEHNAFWICFVGLLGSIYVQTAMGNTGLRSIGGEALVLMVSAVYLVGACIRNGIWDRTLKPDGTTNLLLSVGTGLVSGLFWAVITYHRYHSLSGSAATCVFIALLAGGLAMVLLTLTSLLYKRRKRQLDEKVDREEE